MNDRNGERRKVGLPNAMTESGLPCGECGCREHWTNGTRKVGTRIMRYRVCRNCGHRFVTYESVPAAKPPV